MCQTLQHHPTELNFSNDATTLKHSKPFTGLDHPAVQELLLSKEKNSNTDGLFKRLSDLTSVTVKVQFDCTKLEDCWVLFNVVLKKYYSIKNRWGDKTSVVLSPHVEEAIRKIQHAEESELNSVLQRATPFVRKKRGVDGTQKTLSTPISFAKLLLKKS